MLWIAVEVIELGRRHFLTRRSLQIMDTARLSNDLKSSDSSIRAAAAQQLAQLEAGAQAAAVDLVRATADDDDSVRQWATSALESLGPPRAADAGKLSKLLADPKPDTAYWAATLLGRLEADAAMEVPQLASALDSHPEPAVRERAAWALGQIGPRAASSLPALELAAADSSPRLSRLAREAIARIK